MTCVLRGKHAQDIAGENIKIEVTFSSIYLLCGWGGGMCGLCHSIQTEGREQSGGSQFSSPASADTKLRA